MKLSAVSMVEEEEAEEREEEEEGEEGGTGRGRSGEGERAVSQERIEVRALGGSKASAREESDQPALYRSRTRARWSIRGSERRNLTSSLGSSALLAGRRSLCMTLHGITRQ